MAKSKQTTPKKNVERPSATTTETRAERRVSQILAQKPLATMPFDRLNYLLLAGCVGLVALGYTIMRMDNTINGFISLYVAPLILLAGYLGVVYAIMKRPHRERIDQ